MVASVSYVAERSVSKSLRRSQICCVTPSWFLLWQASPFGMPSARSCVPLVASEQVRARQTRQIVCCQILVCHNSACLLRLLLMFLSAGRSDDPLSPRSSTALGEGRESLWFDFGFIFSPVYQNARKGRTRLVLVLPLKLLTSKPSPLPSSLASTPTITGLSAVHSELDQNQ